MGSEKKLCFMSWNTNGLKTKLKTVKREIANRSVVFLQETHSRDGKIFQELKDYKSFHTTQQLMHTGVAILIKTKIFEESRYPTECWLDPTGCYIVVKCTLQGQLFTLVSVYNCHSDIKPLLELRSVLEKHAEGILLIGGDFNVPLNPYLDRTSKRRNKSHLLFKPVVEEFMTSFHLVDVWRRLHPKTRQYSYSYYVTIKSSENGQKVLKKVEEKSRLDYIFVPEESMQYIKKCEISPDKSCSDHYPVVFEIIRSKSKKLELFMIVMEKENRDFLKFQQSVVNKWLSCKQKCGMEPDLTVNPHTSLMISASEVERAIQSLVVKHVKRPDGLPLSFYKSYSYVLIPYLCVFYHNILEQTTNIPEAFRQTIAVSETHIFNIDYLILATIMARWLFDHLQSHSSNYTVGENTKTVLFINKNAPVSVEWCVLKEELGKKRKPEPSLLDKEKVKYRTEPPLLDELKIAALDKFLKHYHSGKLLFWGCPLTPVLMTLYLKHVADELVEKVKDQRASIHISRENVIVRFSHEFNQNLLEDIKGKYTNVDCTTLEMSEQPDEEMPSVEDLNLREYEE